LLAAGLFITAYATRRQLAFGEMESAGLDLRTQLMADRWAPAAHERRIVFVDFDDATLQNLGDPTDIPPPALSRVLSTLSGTRPALVFVDIDTTVADKTKVAPLIDAL